jgi:hypothetical protein
MVFFLNGSQQQIVEQALSLAGQTISEKTRAARNAAAITEIARAFADQHESVQESDTQGGESDED